MAQVLKVEEWQAGRRWYIADVFTWTGWREMANVLGAPELPDFIELLKSKYGVEEASYIIYEDGTDLLQFWSYDYKKFHKLKLDVNRIARKTNYLVEKVVWNEQKL